MGLIMPCLLNDLSKAGPSAVESVDEYVIAHDNCETTSRDKPEAQKRAEFESCMKKAPPRPEKDIEAVWFIQSMNGFRFFKVVS